MKIIEKFEQYLIATVGDNLSSNFKYTIGKKDDGRFCLNNFHPAGEPEAFICYVIKGSA